MTVYSYLFGLLIAYVSYVVYQKYSDVYSSIVVKPAKRYDYIIVGAGSAGCVLAARLSEDPSVRVLLVEAGDHMGYFTKIPLTPTAAQQGPNDWAFRSTRQKFSSFGLYDQTQFIPRGKGLGGSGQINYLLHGFGLPGDYTRWTSEDFQGWTMKNLKPYFIKAFGTLQSEFDSGYCSFDGHCPADKAPMKLKRIDNDNELMKAFKRASALSRDRYTTSIFRKPTATIKDGMRYTSYDAYLKPALKRKNLHVLLNTQAVSIRFENKTASSLFILQNHRDLNNIFATKEIILAAGAIKTPQLLILSGVGPRKMVQSLGIPLVAANEHVGANLHDHLNVPVYCSVEQKVTITLAKVFHINTVLDYYWRGGGLLSFPPIAGVEYRNETAVMLFSMGTASERLLRDLSNYDAQVFRSTFPFSNNTRKEGFIFLSTCVQPKSRGVVAVTQPASRIQPDIDPRYLEQGEDVQCMIKALRRAEELVSSPPFRDIGAQIHWPRPERCLTFWNYSAEDQIGSKIKTNQKSSTKDKGETSKASLSPPKEYLECIVREIAVTGHHVGGTCAGGKVVDSQLRVKHIKGVRVMDASVLPAPVSLYPNSVLVAMAERAADLIRGAIKH